MRRVSLFGLSVLLACLTLQPLSHAQRKDNKAAASVKTTGAPAGIETITAQQMREILTFIAADELEGRDTPSRGLNVAAKFLAFNLSRWGFKPAGDNGTFFQGFTLQRGQLDGSQTKVELGGQSFKLGEDFIPRAVQGTAKGQLVYVSHGYLVKAKNVNPYAGLDVKDKIVVVAEGYPKGVQPGDLKGKLGEDYDTAANYARTHGAKGLVLVPNPTVLGRWEMLARSAQGGGRATLGSAQDPNGLPTVTASAKLLTAIFQGEATDGAAILKQAATNEYSPGFALNSDKQLSLSVLGKLDALPTQNVVAIWEGSDPILKNEYIAVGAHYDHVGVRPKSDEGKTDGWSRYKLFLESAGVLGNDDRLSNGADDDGSGTTAVLAIAEALAKAPRPKRSVLLVWHAGEEKGLWGSEYVTNNPPVPLNQIATQLNIDMIGRSAKEVDSKKRDRVTLEDEIYVIGSKMMSSELGALSEAVNDSYLKLKFNYMYDEPNDPQRLFYRSDHFNYARKGIPIIFYFDGINEDYHKVSDQVEKIDFGKMEKVTRTVYATLWELANRGARVKVDKPLPAQYSGN
ncbi:MAG: M28 family peptidase [Acidobacteria bacterium]|nr:M28 family peptidase [Acidobacteriota bacterium]MBI3421447.1 M28 family peptidase [Acidobacteriota bacterium]